LGGKKRIKLLFNDEKAKRLQKGGGMKQKRHGKKSNEVKAESQRRKKGFAIRKTEAGLGQ